MAFADIRVGDLLRILPTEQNQVRNCHRLFSSPTAVWRRNNGQSAIPKPDDRLLVIAIQDGDDVNRNRFLLLQNVSNLTQEGWVELWEEGYQGWCAHSVWQIVSRTE